MSFVQLTPLVARLTVPAAGPYARHASNVYLVGASGTDRVLVDTGNGAGAARLGSALAGAGVSLAAVVLTHAHGGHAGGLAATPNTRTLTARSVRDGAAVGPLLRAVHTPGHAADALSLWLADERALLVGDAVSSTPFESSTTPLHPRHQLLDDLPAYSRSLANLAALGPRLVFPGHGDVISDGLDYISQAQTCVKRTSSVILSLVSHNHAITALDITRYLLDDNKWAMALSLSNQDFSIAGTSKTPQHSVVLEGTVKLHLLDLEKKGLIQRVYAAKNDTQNVSDAQRNMTGPGGLTFNTIFDAVKSSRQKDWEQHKDSSNDTNNNNNKNNDEQIFRVREQVHPAHLRLGLSRDIGWTIVSKK
ncbi:beta-lactamase-like protein [Obelidium mucronatum]|nr:beta-lactamase-like protein [Obelidium mucronatum]